MSVLDRMSPRLVAHRKQQRLLAILLVTFFGIVFFVTQNSKVVVGDLQVGNMMVTVRKKPFPELFLCGLVIRLTPTQPKRGVLKQEITIEIATDIHSHSL